MNNGKICVSVCAETADDMIERIKRAEALADVIAGKGFALDDRRPWKIPALTAPDVAMPARVPNDPIIEGAPGKGRRRHAGEALVPQHASIDEVHHIERAADHALVVAERETGARTMRQARRYRWRRSTCHSSLPILSQKPVACICEQ